MISRRIFGACGLCAALELVAAPVDAQTAAVTGAASGGIARQILTRGDVPGTGYETVQVSATVEPGVFVAWHTHPGLESSFVLEGEGTLMVKGRANLVTQAGAGFLIPPETPHAVQNSGKLLRIAATYVVEKGKPLSTPAPQ